MWGVAVNLFSILRRLVSEVTFPGRERCNSQPSQWMKLNFNAFSNSSLLFVIVITVKCVPPFLFIAFVCLGFRMLSVLLNFWSVWFGIGNLIPCCLKFRFFKRPMLWISWFTCCFWYTQLLTLWSETLR